MSASQTPSEHHLGDRLAALVDGELDHDERERVLAHLATCARCKADADCQRRLKNVFAEVAPPPPSAGFLARLQSLPAGRPQPPDDADGGPGAPGREPFGHGVFDAQDPRGPLADTMDAFAFAGAHGASVFPVHRAGQQERSARRGRRFAFAAAGAVSLAAVALGGTLPLGSSTSAPARNNVVPLRAVGTSATAETGRRNGASGGGLLPQSGTPARTVAAPGTLQARNLPAVPGLSALPGRSGLSTARGMIGTARMPAMPGASGTSGIPGTSGQSAGSWLAGGSAGSAFSALAAHAPSALTLRAFMAPSSASSPFPAAGAGVPALPASAVNSGPAAPSLPATDQVRGAAARPELLAGPGPLSGTR
ncbi:zf-HC2 domain-containing protein [Streptomyces sp. NPDC047002]|uniref:zf-HC2 domain-containing protein n=1 Tax=Streptomyces sp. NPDC047002 TaxID=3155475 RepID=UPI00345419EF